MINFIVHAADFKQGIKMIKNLVSKYFKYVNWKESKVEFNYKTIVNNVISELRKVKIIPHHRKDQ